MNVIRGKNWIPNDSLNKSGALELAADIKAYWLDRGFNVDVWVERVTQKPESKEGVASIFAIRSNLNEFGLPQGADANVVF